MSSIPLPALDIHPPQPNDALGSVEKLMALKSMMGQQQVQQQQIQAGQLENQQRQMDLQDQQNIRAFAPKYIQKDDSGKITGYDADGYFNALMGAGVSPAKVAVMRNQQAEATKNLAGAGKAQLDLQDQKNDQAYQILEGVRSVAKDPKADPAGVQTAYQQGISKVAQLGIDTSKYPPQYPGDETLNQFEAGLGVHKQIIADAKTQADTNQENAKAGLEKAQMFLEQNKADIINAYKQNPGALLSQIDAIAPPSGPNAALNARTKSQVQFALGNGDVEGAKGALKQAAEQVGAVEKETNPAVQQGKVAVAKAEGQARANIEAAQSRGSNAALAQVPPHLVAPATADATRAGSDYAQAQSVTQRLSAMMDAAKKGNVVSYQLIPEEGALQVVTNQGIHRINMAEIQNYGGGSAWQRLEGHVGKALTGESIPNSVLGDMADIQKIMAEGSRTKYENTLKTINQNYGSTFKPVDMGQGANAPSGPQATKTYQGHTYAQQSDGSWKLQQ